MDLFREMRPVSAKYLLPCECGQHVTVESRQAGESIVCACGKPLSVPTVLQMRTLELAPESLADAQRTTRVWGGGDRMLLMGTVLLLVVVVSGVWLVMNRPISPYEAIGHERIRDYWQSLSPWQSWEVWEGLKKGIDPRQDPWYEARVRNFYVVLVATIALAAVGAGLLVGGFQGLKKRRSSSG
jgi:hypothetical protein